MDGLVVGVCRPDADPRANPGVCRPTAWLMHALDGSLWSKEGRDQPGWFGWFDQGDRLGVLVDLNVGSLLFFKNGEQHGPGYPAGSVTGPVALGAQMCYTGQSVRLLPDAAWPAGHAR